jgi:hypothetical protein
LEVLDDFTRNDVPRSGRITTNERRPEAQRAPADHGFGRPGTRDESKAEIAGLVVESFGP